MQYSEGENTAYGYGKCHIKSKDKPLKDSACDHNKLL